MRAAVMLVCGLVGFSAPAMAQQQGLNILTIFDQFAVSNAVASKCVKPDPAKLAKFLLNFQIVSTHASIRLQGISPSSSNERIDQVMKDRYGEIDKHISSVIAQETCNGPKVREALKRFDVQADIDFSGAMKPK